MTTSTFDFTSTVLVEAFASITAASKAETELGKATEKRDGFVLAAAKAFHAAGVGCAHIGHEGTAKDAKLIKAMDDAIINGLPARQQTLIAADPKTLKPEAKKERDSAVSNLGPRRNRIRNALATVEAEAAGLDPATHYVDHKTGEVCEVKAPEKKEQVRVKDGASDWEKLAAFGLNFLYATQQIDPENIPEDIKCNITQGVKSIQSALKQLGITVPK